MTAATPQHHHPSLVGREREQSLLRAWRDEAAAGETRVVLIAGEPGIGKTRLAEELATEARGSGLRTYWGHCYEWEGTPAYWPWVEIVRDYAEDADPDDLREQLGHGASLVAQIVPEIARVLPDLPELPSLHPEQARFQLFDSLARFLRQAARKKPLLLVLDDLHWADPPSLLLLEFIVRELDDASLLLVGTYRDVAVRREHPLAATLAALTRSRTTRRLALAGLDREDVSRIVQQLSGGTPSQQVVDAVYAETEGNPFFVTEVARLLAGRPDPSDASGPGARALGIPEGVREAIGRRLDGLSRSCNEVLAIASVVGRDFELDLLERVSEQAADELLDVLDEAVDAGVISEREQFGRYRFSHALIQETLYDELSTSRRVRLHSQVGNALEALHSTDRSTVYGELARHFANAPIGENLTKAIDYATKAGEQAMAQLAWESAVGHYQRAVELLEAQPDADPIRLCEVLLALGEAQNRVAAGRPRTGNTMVLGAGGSPHGLATFWKAAGIARDAGTPEQLARAALGVVGFNPYPQQAGVEGVRLLEEALERLPADDHPLRVQILARLGADPYMLAFEHTKLSLTEDLVSQMRSRSDAAVAMARRLNDPAILAYALVMRGLQHELRTPDERLADAEGAIGAATAEGERPLLAWGLRQKMGALEELGEIAAASAVLEQLDHVASELRLPFFLWNVAIFRADAALLFGRLEEAEQFIDQADDVQPLSGAGTVLRIALRREQGRGEELLDLLARFVTYNPPSVRVLRLICQLEADQRAAAQDGFEAIAAGGFPQQGVDLRGLARLAEVCAELELAEQARPLYEHLLPDAGRPVSPSSSESGGCVSYYLGLLATTMERWDDAERHFGEALAKNAEWGYRLYVAYTRYAWADMLVHRGRPGDRERARQLLEQARSAGDEMGMVRLLRLIAALEKRIGQPRATYPAGLTAREVEVLRLVTQGLTDAEVAERLYVSRRTVSTHLTSIYNKLGVGTRTQAAVFAKEHGLV